MKTAVAQDFKERIGQGRISFVNFINQQDKTPFRCFKFISFLVEKTRFIKGIAAARILLVCRQTVKGPPQNTGADKISRSQDMIPLFQFRNFNPTDCFRNSISAQLVNIFIFLPG
ncbi:MAG: hypothetical protein D3904_09450 [Candidatus Electrothrix sp. EH2]|nr:hypothetical protein [Candidatus Electrothrix sp. EH2]